jgi:hypothetical protein
MIVNEILAKAAAISVAKSSPAMKISNALAAIPDGNKPTGKLADFLQKLDDKACKDMLKQVLANPDNYGVNESDHTAKEIRNGANCWVQFIDVCEHGYLVTMNVDTDDIGGDSTNHEELTYDLSGKLTKANLGKAFGSFDAQENWTRQDPMD